MVDVRRAGSNGNESVKESMSPLPGSAGPVLLQRGVQNVPERPGRGAIWTQRLFLLIFVVFCIELGMLLVVLPWTKVWTENNFLLDHPALRHFVGQQFVRGAVSGLGLVDIWIGLWEAVHYREK
jgi:hypothetical protein